VIYTPLLCIDTRSSPMRVRRYVRNQYHKVWLTHIAELGDINPDVPRQLEEFRQQPQRLCVFPKDHIPEGAA
jgi:hypothetical protein